MANVEAPRIPRALRPSAYSKLEAGLATAFFVERARALSGEGIPINQLMIYDHPDATRIVARVPDSITDAQRETLQEAIEAAKKAAKEDGINLHIPISVTPADGKPVEFIVNKINSHRPFKHIGNIIPTPR